MDCTAPLLSLCIPTYNRADVLDETLLVLLSDPDFDPEKVEVVVCDNCSTDHTPDVAAKYPAVRYFRNEENVHDANFSRVLLHSTGEYLKLMNDTVRFLSGGLKFLLDNIEANLGDKPTIFFYERGHGSTSRIILCRTLGEFVGVASLRATWIGNFGIWRRDLPVVADVRSVATQLLQVDWSYRIAAANPVCIYLSHICKPAAIPTQTKGGYSVFKVFVENYLSLSAKYLEQGVLSRWQYEKNKFALFNGFAARRAVWLLFRSERIIHFDNEGAWQILMRHYGYHLYFYLWIFFYGLLYVLKGFR